MNVNIPEKLFFDVVDLLVEPQSLRPQEGTCVLSLDARNQVLERLLQIRHQFLFDPPPASAKV
jgi:hypothetical protein